MVKIEQIRVASEWIKRKEAMIPWVSLLGEEVCLSDIITVKKIETGIENIAGVDVPFFVTAHIDIKQYDLFLYPLWVDEAVNSIRAILSLQAEESVLSERLRCLERELSVTSQRVNLFEKVKIPEAKEAVRKILIFLGDQQTAAMGWARIAKKKIEGENT